MNAAETELVKALRSGKYTQAKHYLRTPDGYCCLGVACDISKIAEWVNRDDYINFYYADEDLSLPSSVRLELDWSNNQGACSFLGRDDEPVYLSDLNDIGMTFDQIADIIENNLILKIGESDGSDYCY